MKWSLLKSRCSSYQHQCVVGSRALRFLRFSLRSHCRGRGDMVPGPGLPGRAAEPGGAEWPTPSHARCAGEGARETWKVHFEDLCHPDRGPVPRLPSRGSENPASASPQPRGEFNSQVIYSCRGKKAFYNGNTDMNVNSSNLARGQARLLRGPDRRGGPARGWRSRLSRSWRRSPDPRGFARD